MYCSFSVGLRYVCAKYYRNLSGFSRYFGGAPYWGVRGKFIVTDRRMNSFKNMNVCIKTCDDPFQTSGSGFKSCTNRRTSAACLKMLTLAGFFLVFFKSRLWLELSLSLLPPYLCLWPHWICQCLHAELLAMSSYGSYSPLTLSIISARRWNSNKASDAFPETWRPLFTPKLFGTRTAIMYKYTIHAHSYEPGQRYCVEARFKSRSGRQRASSVD